MTDIYTVSSDFRLVSGGQAGADAAALDWAIAHGVAHGGWCPKGRRSEAGPIDDRYRLVETPSSNYLHRTEWNVRDSEATVIFTLNEALEGGSKRTAQYAEKHGKPWLHFRSGVHPKFLARFLATHGVGVLNVAGKRASTSPGIERLVAQTLDASLIASTANSAGYAAT